jgi:shikimate kinase
LTDLPPHLILIGLPGAGKTTVGRAAARLANRPFLDFDEEIERREGRRVAEIFAEAGEEYFRELESDLTREVVGRSGMVLAPGGGWAAEPARVALLRPPARMIYLRVSPAAAVGRLGVEIASRPLLQGPDPVAEMTRLLRLREGQYAAADQAIDTEAVALHEVITAVAHLATA